MSISVIFLASRHTKKKKERKYIDYAVFVEWKKTQLVDMKSISCILNENCCFLKKNLHFCKKKSHKSLLNAFREKNYYFFAFPGKSLCRLYIVEHEKIKQLCYVGSYMTVDSSL